MKNFEVIAKAPGKIILSGEHSVVYGKPAIAMAIDKFVTTKIGYISNHDIIFEFLNNSSIEISNLHELRELKIKLTEHYKEFIKGKIPIRKVIISPIDLIKYAFIYVIDTMSLNINHGLKITINIDFSIGCGMGASAALILSILYALTKYFNYTITNNEYLDLSKKIENLQHGYSSGLDIFLSLNGGCYLFDKNIKKISFPNIPLLLVNTGKPMSSTGECVEKVAYLMKNNKLIKEFEAVTCSINIALENFDINLFKIGIQKNHALLSKIGVVPKKVSNFIDEITNKGNVAKISGAGTVSGDNAGIVLVVGSNDITEIVLSYGYEIILFKEEKNGVYFI